MKVKHRTNGDVAILVISGNVEGGSDAELFRSEVADILNQGHKKILLDMSDVPWMNSTGIGIIMAGLTSITNAGGVAKFLNVKDRVKSILMIMKLLNVIESYYSEEEAVASF